MLLHGEPVKGADDQHHGYGILFIADGVQSGFGRTGKMFAIQHYAVTPYVMVLAKGIADGFPLSAFIAPEEVADAVIEGLAAERFLILPHPEVAEYFQRKATDYDRWLRGMRRLQAIALEKQ